MTGPDVTRWWQLLCYQSARAKHLRSPTGDACKDLARSRQYSIGHLSHRPAGDSLARAHRLAARAGAASLGATRHADRPQLEGGSARGSRNARCICWPRRFANWDALLEDAAKEVRDQLAQSGPLSERTWGERNTAKICHPLAGAIPLLGKRLLCMPPDQLAGDGAMPRVQGPAFGASERMVVAPGHEAQGIIHARRPERHRCRVWGSGHAIGYHDDDAVLAVQPLHTCL